MLGVQRRRPLDRASADPADPLPRPHAPGEISRRRFIGYLIAGPTLVAGAQLGVATASAAIPTRQPVDDYDLTDLLTRRGGADLGR